MKSIGKIFNVEFEIILESLDNVIVVHNNKHKGINRMSSLSCFKNNDTKEIIDLIRVYNQFWLIK